MSVIGALISTGPVEIFRLILEMASHSDRRTALNLIYVSKMIKQWTEPLLYRTVILTSGTFTVKLFYCLTLRANGAEFFARNIETLVVCRMMPSGFRFSDCIPPEGFLDRLQSFGQYLSDDPAGTATLICRARNLRRAYLCPETEQYDVIRPALSASSITHLAIRGDECVYDLVTCMPNLTHLALDCELDMAQHAHADGNITTPCPELFDKPLRQWEYILIIVGSPMRVEFTPSGSCWDILTRTPVDPRFVWVTRELKSVFDKVSVTEYVAGGPSEGLLYLNANDPTFARHREDREDMWDVIERIVDERRAALTKT
ncbi:hypothetical protein CYLTODRAFT_417645 [Cylindrobasidium torrendii FP15055 ss-10]|uniref:F-box domain-containing protein n=1 Tax=Cylindrobasidium torrendii FP15055 ss-10 TaxID=1314674 RepID=A0A0D7BR22_9AGAR|nr:hypothetical protein CYLTODRAFT_417645 [Cylindrobasidium torrendii FP15055 ss-10]